MTLLRSLLFNVLFIGWTVVAAVGFLPVLALPHRAVMRVLRLWAGVIAWLLRVVAGLEYEVRGRANVPDEPALFAYKHQSAWETIMFALLIPDFVGVMKRELAAIPLIGFYLSRMGMIAIDRAGAATALRRMVAQARERLADGRSIVVAPEGTRAAPGEHRRYLPGIAALYGALGVPVVPVALNSGLFWGRRTFIKRPGVITVEFLEPIEPGLDRRAFLAELAERIEPAADRLAEEARAKYFDAR